MKAAFGAKGFTLIELMIVLVIMGMLAAFVAPIGYKELQKSRAKTEFLTFRNIIKLHTTKAFAQGVRYQMKMNGNALVVKSVLGERAYQYEYLQLPNLTFHINANGYPTVNQFDVSLPTASRAITLEDMLGVKQDLIYAKE